MYNHEEAKNIYEGYFREHMTKLATAIDGLRPETSGLDRVKNSFEVQVIDGKVSITGLNIGQLIQIYTIDGRLLKTISVENQRVETLDISSYKGILLFQIGSQIFKIAC